VNGSSRGILLVCEECGEKTVLDGPLSVNKECLAEVYSEIREAGGR
jgi:cell pole-organizing protein PopZ